jgi:hypothetical protein
MTLIYYRAVMAKSGFRQYGMLITRTGYSAVGNDVVDRSSCCLDVKALRCGSSFAGRVTHSVIGNAVKPIRSNHPLSTANVTVQLQLSPRAAPGVVWIMLNLQDVTPSAWTTLNFRCVLFPGHRGGGLGSWPNDQALAPLGRGRALKRNGGLKLRKAWPTEQPQRLSSRAFVERSRYAGVAGERGGGWHRSFSRWGLK